MPSYAIVGASRGIGLEFVKQLSADPKNVVFGLVRNPAGSTKLTEIKAPNVHVVKADITDRKSLDAAAAEVAKVTGGSLDVLVNNAALLPEGRTQRSLGGYGPDEQETLAEDLREAFNVNVVGVVHSINAFLPLLKKGSLKKVITLSTGTADVDFTLKVNFPITAPYSISKAALNMVVAKYAVEYKNEGIAFLAISPGLVNTSEKPPSPEELEVFKALIATFQKDYPHWNGPITPEESVKLMLKVINGFTIEQTGAFVSHYGNKQWL
ncbi:NAD P-binding protein [Gloeophyllum trabeum ATCC 11539]|uniref:NAD P-binding protein n=1 Tax=Gloeophyllum trabeum (strain ATCC 11539 / FP-39264 / Madison 617) TaxID=670483 RepID=S7QLH5_GLOTA|nr:NAD P-binding protein [Gloeophyllum trabeum ATCC 11539]EPQ60223.1 NAD P-binding protein [Gloeophyllum trabeum ATCC 11539]